MNIVPDLHIPFKEMEKMIWESKFEPAFYPRWKLCRLLFKLKVSPLRIPDPG